MIKRKKDVGPNIWEGLSQGTPLKPEHRCRTCRVHEDSLHSASFLDEDVEASTGG